MVCCLIRSLELQTHLVIDIISVNRDPAAYVDPLRFDGMRFAKGHGEAPLPYEFGWGNRACPGQFFSRLYQRIVLEMLHELNMIVERTSDGCEPRVHLLGVFRLCKETFLLKSARL